ncbi:hypothetical protein LTR53_017232 [Teratosphaeriaceae sp. CCFEE 6253]|nr:hypothetical protein LTR53_017232 [Teratosphaeriaceae sp. CCFEE 6253]
MTVGPDGDDTAPAAAATPSRATNAVAGAVGKLRIHASGRATLDWGGTMLEVGMGGEVGFLQDVVVLGLPDRKKGAAGEGASGDEQEEAGEEEEQGWAMGMGQVKGKYISTAYKPLEHPVLLLKRGTNTRNTPPAITSSPKQTLLTIPRTPLLFDQPPIIQPLHRLQAALGPSCPVLWICREDCNSGLAFGGNKVRKLEYVIRAALDEGCDTLVTTGGIQSNHMRQTAAAAAYCGLKCVLVPKDMVSAEDPTTYGKAGNVQINTILGAETVRIGTTMDEAVELVRSRGGKPYEIPGGASEHPLGGLGYARWMCQVGEWEEANDTHFDAVVSTGGGCSTLAGVVVGSKLVGKPVGKPRRIIGIGIFDKPAEEMTETTLRIAHRTTQRIGLPDGNITADAFEMDMQYNAGAYGRLDDRTRDAVTLVARTEGILLDPVYTGKTMAGLLAKIRSGQLEGAKNVLFLHTGGQASLSAYPQLR